MIKRVSTLVATTAFAAALLLAAIALPAQAAVRHIDGTVVSKNAGNRSFQIKTQSGNQLRIRVSAGTKFQRIAGGFSGLHRGLAIEVGAKTTSSGLVATHVETRGGGGGDNGGGAGSDDGPNHA